jgi:hypothetical protein
MSLDQRRQRIRLSREGSSTIELAPMRPAGSPGGPAPGPASPNAPSPLSDYVGTYGDRTLSIVDRKLHVQRPNGRLMELVPTSRDAFGIAGIPAAKIEFVRDAAGKVSEIRVLNQRSQWETVGRDSCDSTVKR